LASRLKDKAAIEKDINETNAKREQLEELVKDLQSEVARASCKKIDNFSLVWL